MLFFYALFFSVVSLSYSTTQVSCAQHSDPWFLKVTFHLWASLGAQLVKNPPPMWETQVGSLGGEDPLEKEMAAYSSILAWRIPRTEEPGGPQFMGSQNWTGPSL